MTRREFIGGTGLLLADGEQRGPKHEWIRSARIVLMDAFNPPFYPIYEYDPDKAVAIVRRLNANAVRIPALAYYAYYPTRTKYPTCPGLGGRDRSQTHRVTWTRMHRLAVRWLPQPRVLHPYPENRFAVRYLRQEPYALMSARTDLCGGC
jgi:hypothetical protein